MSGGVDSAVAALLCARSRRRRRRGHARAVARRRERRRAQLLLGERGPRRARRSRTGLGLPHLTLDLRDEFRAGVVEPYLADHAAGLTPNPCIRCNGHVRLDAMVDLADRLGAARARDRALRARGRRRPPAARRATRRRTRRTCSPGCGRRRSRGCAFPLGDLRKPEVRALAREAGHRRRRQARLAGPLLPRRHRPRRVPRAPRRHPRPAGGHRRPPRRAPRPPPRPPPLHRRPAARASRSAAAPADPLYVLADRRRARTPSPSARARRSRRRGFGPRRSACTATRRRSREVRLRYRSQARPLPPAAATRSSCSSPSTAPRPARPRCSSRATTRSSAQRDRSAAT